jgi:hypothetical protein
VVVVADWLRPIHNEMARNMFTGPYVGVDEPSVAR